MIIHPTYGPQYDPTDGTVGEIQLVKKWGVGTPGGRLVHALQGRYMKATKAEAQKLCNEFKKANQPGSHYYQIVKNCQPVQYWCWPGHYDPAYPVN